MSAEDCLNHSWLVRRVPREASNMEVAKDNLRQFVERWNEHPNSPYVFESSSHIIAPCSGTLQLSASLHSLEGMSPSPCGSLASSTESDDDSFNGISNNYVEGSLTVVQPDHIRRASDSTCVLKGTDITERLNLAEEIRKLTDKLFQLSSMPEFNTSSDTKKKLNIPPLNSTVSSNVNGHHSNIPRSPAIMITSPKSNSIPSSSNEEIPWRRRKFKITGNSRDVPLSPKFNMNFSRHFESDLASLNNTINYKAKTNTMSTSQTSNNENSVTGTKDMLLKLLEQWDGPQVPSRPIPRHGSVSSEWSESDSLGQRTISSLNMFFQSRSINKNSHPFMKPNGLK